MPHYNHFVALCYVRIEVIHRIKFLRYYLKAKFMCHVRLKRSGAWWYEANSNHMLALRCAKYNGTLAQVFVHYQQQQRGA